MKDVWICLFSFFFVSIFLIGGCDFYAPKDLGLTPLTQEELAHPTFAMIKQNIFEPKCLTCHSPGKIAFRVPLDTKEDLLHSPLDLVIPWDVEDSTLLTTVTRNDSRRMPPPRSGISALTNEEVKLIQAWIELGCGEPKIP